MIIYFAKALKESLIPIAILIFANGFRFDFRDGNFFSNMLPLLIVVVLLVSSLLRGILRWWTFSYWFEERELRVQYGLFVKKKRFIPYDRIQSLNYKEGIFHRLFGLVQVTVETAGNKAGKAEAELIAITKSEAQRIEDETHKKHHQTEVIEESIENQSRIIHQMTTKNIFIVATTSGGVGVIVAGVFALVSQFAEFIPYEWLYEEMAYLFRFGVLLFAFLAFLGLLFAWMASVMMTFINYYNFTVLVENERIIITRGLLEKKRSTIPLNRVQAIKMMENPIRQIFGYVTVIVESAGGSFSGEKDKTIVLFPLIKKKKVVEPLQALFPHLQFAMHEGIKPPERARPFFYRIQFLPLIPIVGVFGYFFFPYGLLMILLVVPIYLVGRWRFATARFEVTAQQLTIVSRFISKVTFIAERKRIQIVEQRQSYFQKRKDVATAKIVVMSGEGGASAKAYNMEARKIDELMDWYEN